MPLKPRLGRIRYINVLPLHYAFDQGWVVNGCQVHTGTPAELNARMQQGTLDLSAISSYEYGRNFRNYYLLPELAIATRGDVGSVLFFSRLPFHRLTLKEVLLSAGSATSAALVKVVLAELYGARPLYRVGPVTDCFLDGCYGMLAIGDEALRLKARGCYPYYLDLGQAWYELTGLPFVFGVWAVQRRYFAAYPELVQELHQRLLQAKNLGLQALPEVCREAARSVPLSPAELAVYFQRLNYDLGVEHQEGLLAFFRYLHKYGDLAEMPELTFIATP